MPVIAWGSDVWQVVHAGFPENPNDYTADVDMQMSNEFAAFLSRWSLGDFGPSDFHSQNFAIATRKSCYKQPLLNNLGVFTEQGERVAARAKSYLHQMRLHYSNIGIAVPTFEQANKMDTIVLAGFFRDRHINFLKALYLQNYPIADPRNRSTMTAQMPTDFDYLFTNYGDQQLMLTTTLRSYPQRRMEFEYLVKMGLIRLIKLPKPSDRSHKGRNPIGGLLTEAGKLFFEDFVNRYDPQVRKQAAFLASMPADLRDDD